MVPVFEFLHLLRLHDFEENSAHESSWACHYARWSFASSKVPPIFFWWHSTRRDPSHNHVWRKRAISHDDSSQLRRWLTRPPSSQKPGAGRQPCNFPHIKMLWENKCAVFESNVCARNWVVGTLCLPRSRVEAIKAFIQGLKAMSLHEKWRWERWISNSLSPFPPSSQKENMLQACRNPMGSTISATKCDCCWACHHMFFQIDDLLLELHLNWSLRCSFRKLLRPLTEAEEAVLKISQDTP